LNGSFGGGVTMFEVPAGGTFISPGLIQKKLGSTGAETPSLTRILFDPDEYQPLNVDLPFDTQTLFLRVEEYSSALGGYLSPNEILVIPPPKVFGVHNFALPVYGSAPALASNPIAGDLPHAGMMIIAPPRYATGCIIQSMDTVDPVLVSFDAGQPIVPIQGVNPFPIIQGFINKVYICSSSKMGINFTLIFTICQK
jgi:hypothetical protein